MISIDGLKVYRSTQWIFAGKKGTDAFFGYKRTAFGCDRLQENASVPFFSR